VRDVRIQIADEGITRLAEMAANGPVVIPRAARDALGLTSSEQLMVNIRYGSMVLTPVEVVPVDRTLPITVDTTRSARDTDRVGLTWAASADEHAIPRDEAIYAMSHPHMVVGRFGEPRVGPIPPTLFIRPSRYGTLEVLATVAPPNRIHVFHVMPLREKTRAAVGYQEEE